MPCGGDLQLDTVCNEVLSGEFIEEDPVSLLWKIKGHCESWERILERGVQTSDDRSFTRFSVKQPPIC